MFSIPFAFSGVLMALFFTGTNLNVMSLLGGIMLIGIVVKNGIVLIDYITLCRERGQAVLHSVVTAGTQPFASGINDYTDHYPRYGADGCRAG